MKTAGKIGIVVALAAATALVIVLKQSRSAPSSPDQPAVTSSGESAPSAGGLPRFIELGSVSCIPCKMMAPILAELRSEYAGSLQVDFIDITEDRDAARKFSIRAMPTQVFLDAGGKELFRHEGFFPKEELLAKWKELGVELKPAGEAAVQP